MSVIRCYGNRILNLTHFEAIEKQIGSKLFRPKLLFYGRRTEIGVKGTLTQGGSSTSPHEIEFKSNEDLDAEFASIKIALERHIQ